MADGRISVNELATRVGVSRATAYSRLDRLRSDGVITGFTATVDPAKVGHGVAAELLTGGIHIHFADFRIVCNSQVVVYAPYDYIFSVKFHFRPDRSLKPGKGIVSVSVRCKFSERAWTVF
jgi:DNA-binding Lrp family transcriptional regulator